MSLSEFNKKIKSQRKIYWLLREWYVVFYITFSRWLDRPASNSKKRILFYHDDILGFGGTEKFLQILEKYLNKEKYDVYLLYKNFREIKSGYGERLNYVREGGVITVPFDLKEKNPNPPFFIKGMNPEIKKLLKTLKINLLVVAGTGAALYPFSAIKNIPIILLNIFGQPNVQDNIRFHLCISKEVAAKLSPIVPENKIKVLPVPSERPPAESKKMGEDLRRQFNIKETDMVFGRIGRTDNGIFDKIGIGAFKKVVAENPTAHYLIMSPPSKLKEIVQQEGIPNVHFLPSSSSEKDIWAFHQSIDALAHFRHDGESFGLNIVESMLCGKPIITHRSHIWNAQLEYLEPTFSRVADKDDAEQYANFMEEFIQLKKAGRLEALGEAARQKAERFLIENNISRFEKWLDESVVK